MPEPKVKTFKKHEQFKQLNHSHHLLITKFRNKNTISKAEADARKIGDINTITVVQDCI